MSRLWPLLVVASVVVVGCGGDDDDAASADTGTIEIVVEDWAGAEGYRLLAGVWGGADGSSAELIGGAFWTIIDSDPWSGEDVVHPPYEGEGEYEGGPDDGWGSGDYVWDQTAQAEPGAYRVELWANPGELSPFGSHIPADPIERACDVTIEVTAGQTTTVVVSDIPPASEDGGDGCPAARWSSD